MNLPARTPSGTAKPLVILALLYTTQGIPFGVAAEYLPVLMREGHASTLAIATASFLQLPWQTKILWSSIADHPRIAKHHHSVLFGIQTLLALALSLYAWVSFPQQQTLVFAVTALCALLAATQDIFVDAFAVRSLSKEALGLGNTAQVAGYRLGMLMGGALLLLLTTHTPAHDAPSAAPPAPSGYHVPEAWSFGGLALVIFFAGLVARTLRDREPSEVADESAQGPYRSPEPTLDAKPKGGLMRVLKHAFGSETWPVMFLAFFFKFGLHTASVLIKPMVVDAHWTRAQIGGAIVTAGTTAGLVGAGAGGFIYRKLADTRALKFAMVVQCLSVAPLLLTAKLGVPFALTAAAIGAEHFASGLGTTVLFAALMRATRKSSAGAHYTLLMSANAISLGLGGLVGGALGDRFGGLALTFTLAMVLCLVPGLVLRGWEGAREASARE
jgi:MFS transporter, PAT family, beta-lactamase induction signal transducer AmpG